MAVVPPLPPWEGLHPLVVHFPIALLMVAPVLVILGLIWFTQHRALFIAGLVLMTLGTASAYLAVATGEAAHELVSGPPPLMATMEAHEELAETARLLFTILTLVYAALVLGPVLARKDFGRGVTTIAHVVFILVYLGCTLVLANAGHLGGVLVHGHGVRALIGPLPPPPAEAGDHSATHGHG